MIDWRWVEVDTLENKGEWNEAKSLLIENWNQNPNDLKTVIRLGFLCWYVLVEEGPLNIQEEDVDFDELETILHQVTDFGLANFGANEVFLWSFGYMISLFPYYFGEFDYWEEKGFSMLKRAYEICPGEPVYKYSYLASFSNSDEKQYNDVIQKLQVGLKNKFQGNGALSEYFKEVLRYEYENGLY